MQLSIIICTYNYKMCINEGLHSPINKNKQMNQRTHVWSADEVRTTVPAQLVCAVTEIDLVLKM